MSARTNGLPVGTHRTAKSDAHPLRGRTDGSFRLYACVGDTGRCIAAGLPYTLSEGHKGGRNGDASVRVVNRN